MSVRQWVHAVLENRDEHGTPSWIAARTVKLVVEIAFSLLIGVVLGGIAAVIQPTSLELTTSAVEIHVGSLEAGIAAVSLMLLRQMWCQYP